MGGLGIIMYDKKMYVHTKSYIKHCCIAGDMFYCFTISIQSVWCYSWEMDTVNLTLLWLFVWKSGFVYWDSTGYRNDRVGAAVFLFVLLLLFVCF